MNLFKKIVIRIRTRITHSYRLQLILYMAAFFFVILSYVLIFWYYYPLYEGQNVSLMKSFLFVMETITTVGYGEFVPFKTDEMAFVAIVIMASGIVAFFGIINILITPMIQSRIRPVPPQKLSFIPKDHVVIFGYSRVIQEVIDNLRVIGTTVVLIEADQDQALKLASRMAPDIQVIWGDYHEEKTWKAAGVIQAGYIILFLEERISARVTLGIKKITSTEIIAVITDNSLEKYLKICGADQVISTKDILGAITALHALLNVDPAILADSDLMKDVLTKTSTVLGSCQITRIPVIRKSHAIGKTLGELNLPVNYQFTSFAVLEKGDILLFPSDSYVIRESTVLILLGNNANLFRMVMEQFITPHKKQLTAIIAGYGDMGMMIGRDLTKLGISTRTIDADASSGPNVLGSAEKEEILIEAGVKNAHFLLVVTNDDDINLFTTLMARELNPDLTIFCRANDPASVPWMYQAGADYVINVPTIIAQALGRLILYDSSQVLMNMRGQHLLVVRYHDIKKTHVTSTATIQATTGSVVIAVDHAGDLIFPGDVDQKIVPGDAVYAFGTPDQISRFIDYL